MLPDKSNELRKMVTYKVSMHLMVLGASRLLIAGLFAASVMVSMHLMVLGASRRGIMSIAATVIVVSQCS